MTLHLNTDDQDKSTGERGPIKEIKTSEEMTISDPVRSEKTINVKYNRLLDRFEGLPTEWRELLELQP